MAAMAWQITLVTSLNTVYEKCEESPTKSCDCAMVSNIYDKIFDILKI